jgi:hypothetical protein
MKLRHHLSILLMGLVLFCLKSQTLLLRHAIDETHDSFQLKKVSPAIVIETSKSVLSKPSPTKKSKNKRKSRSPSLHHYEYEHYPHPPRGQINKKNKPGEPEDISPPEDTRETISSPKLSPPPVSAPQSYPSTPKRKWAYAVLLGGCNSQTPEHYRGFLYNIAVMAQKLQTLGSQADFVALVQLSAATSETTLPPKDVHLLESSGVILHYLPQLASTTHENSYTLGMEQIRVLSMTQYSRVLVLDRALFPTCNFDYLFELSEPTSGKEDAVLKETVLLTDENRSLFMIQPNSTDYHRIQRILRQTEERALSLKYPHWDPIQGWGHTIVDPDQWETRDRQSSYTNWTFPGALTDEGLLYHYFKYVKQQVSIVVGNSIQHYSPSNDRTTPNQDGTDIYVGTDGILNQYSCHPQPSSNKQDIVPYTDFVRFTGRDKPWQQQIRAIAETDLKYQEWFATLKKVESKAGIQIEFEKDFSLKDMGKYPDFRERIQHIREKSRHNWTQYSTCGSSLDCRRF